MAQEFDPYYTWLGIPPSERPADHYRLLGVPRFEENPDVISNAADARMAFIRTFQAGPKGTFTQQILNELAAARTTLLHEKRKASYDQDLKAAVAAKSAGSAVLPVAAAVPAPEQQAILDDLARQLESVKAREALLAKQQAEYAVALAEAGARRKMPEQAAPAIPTARPIVAEPLPVLVTTPIIATRRPVRKQGIALPLLIAGIAIPVVALGLVIGYLATRGKNEPQVIKPSSPDPPTPKIPTPNPKPETTPVTDPPGKKPDKPKTPVVEKPPVVPVSSEDKQVDLLSLVETPRDVPLGQVVREDGALCIRRRGGFTCAVVPYDLPASYELEMLVTPREGEGLLIGLPIGGRRCMLTIDGFLNEPPNKQIRTALETIDGQRPQDNAYKGEPHFGKVLTPGQESRLTIQVASNSVKLTCDDKEIINWSGNPSRLGIYGLFNQGGPKRMFIGSWAAQYDVSRLTLKSDDAPAATPGTKSGLNLLTQIQLPRDLVQGKAARQKDVLSLRSPDGGGFSCVKLPMRAPDNYQLDLRVTSRDAKDGFMVGLSVGGRPCLLGIDGYRLNGTSRTGLEAIDGKRPYEAGFPGPVYRGQLLKDGVESSLSIQVVGGKVSVKCDSQDVLTWTGDPNRLSIAPIFGRHRARSLFVACWSADYDVNSLTVKPLPGSAIASPGTNPNTPTPSPSPATPTTDDRPWRWARFHDGSGWVLTPDKKRAIAFQPGRTPWKIQPIDVATGELGKALEGEGSIESPLAFAAGPELVAFSSVESSGIITLIKSLAGERKRERQFTKQPPEMRYAFSADGKYVAASAGLRVTLINADSGRNLGNIDPPADMRLGFVERLLEDDGMLLVLYTAKKAGSSADHRAVAYDWKSRRAKRSRDFTTRDGQIRGLCFQGDDLWVWGSEFQRGIVTSYPIAGPSEQRLRVLSSQTVADIHIPSQSALVIDSNTPRLTFRTFTTGGNQTQLEYSRPVADARFVEDGKAILCQPGSSADPTLVWETAGLDARRVVAPTLKEVGLENSEQQTAAKAVQRSELNATRPASTASPSPDNGEIPDRDEAKAELAKLGMPMPGGEVRFLNIQSSDFSEAHARLLLAFPELDGLHLQNIRASEKMLEHLAQLPALQNLTIVRATLDDDDLTGLAKAPQLRALNLFETQVEGDGLKHLVDLPLHSFSMAPTPPNLAGWQAIGQFKLLESCGNFGDEQADEKMAAISALPNLKYLNLGGVHLSGEGLKPIAKLTTLVHLDLPQNGLVDADLRPLRDLTNLQMLSLPNSVGDGAVEFLPAAPLSGLRVAAGITDAGLLAIARKYPNLHSCDLTQCTRITEKGLEHLANNGRLGTLVLPGRSSVAMYEQIARMPGLKRLQEPFQSTITAAHLRPLRIHPTLEDLELSKVDEASLAELAQLPALKALHVNVPLCKAKGLEQLAKSTKLERLTLLNGGALREYGPDEAAALAKLTQLKQLTILGTSLDQASMDKIRQALSKAEVQISP